MIQEIITFLIGFTAFFYAGYGLVKLFSGSRKGTQDQKKVPSMCASCKAACTVRDPDQKNHAECLFTGETKI
jgi:hypothetical protein